jgi:hypothetical protein
LYGALKGDVKGVVIVDVVGDVKEAGRAGTEGGVVVGEEPAFVDVEVVLGVAGAGEEVLGAEVEVDAAAAMVPLRSHGFGGEPMVQIRLSTCVDDPIRFVCRGGPMKLCGSQRKRYTRRNLDEKRGTSRTLAE